MRKALKIILPLVLVVVLLITAYWFFFYYRADLTAEFCISRGNHLMESGRYASAVRFYDRAYRLCPGDAELAMKLAQAYRKSGNYTKTEYVLVNAIYANPENTDLYIALSDTYVEEDKLMDAQLMLDQVSNDTARAALEALRPAAPVITPDGGYYSDYISVEAACDGGTCYLTTDGQYPSTANVYTEPVRLEGGETTVCAVAVAENGLVSTAVYQGYTVAGVIEDVTFADKTLEAAVQEMLNKGQRTLQTDDLWGITELEVPEEVTDLSDLVWFTGLTKLTIHDACGSDFAFLQNMPSLKSLTLSGCSLTSENMQVIGSVTSLEELYLSDCGLSNLSALSNLASLRILELNDNSINNLTPLKSCAALEELYLSANALTSLSSLASLKSLSVLDVSYNALEDISPLTACKAMTRLNLAHNQLTDLSALGTMVKLTELDASNNQIEDVSALSACTALETFLMSDNVLTSIDALAEIETITEINIDYNDVEAVPDFVSTCQLTKFSAAHNFLKELNGLADLPCLNYVNADYNNISSIDCLADCPNLVQVNVFGTYVNDVSALTAHGIVVNYNPMN